MRKANRIRDTWGDSRHASELSTPTPKTYVESPPDQGRMINPSPSTRNQSIYKPKTGSMKQEKETAATSAAQQTDIQQIIDAEHYRQAPQYQSDAAAPDSTWTPSGGSGRGKPTARKKDEEGYARRFLTMRKVKEYTPVYIDVRMKEKLQTLITSLQHIVPDITPTMFLSNLLADHIGANKELITRAANEGLKRSLANTFDNERE